MQEHHNAQEALNILENIPEQEKRFVVKSYDVGPGDTLDIPVSARLFTMQGHRVLSTNPNDPPPVKTFVAPPNERIPLFNDRIEKIPNGFFQTYVTAHFLVDPDQPEDITKRFSVLLVSEGQEVPAIAKYWMTLPGGGPHLFSVIEASGEALHAYATWTMEKFNKGS